MAKASRDTTSGRFIAEMDGLRFVAVFAVIFFHLGWLLTTKTGRSGELDPLAQFISHGSVGVPLFFVISGFVIALPFARAYLGDGEPPTLKSYFSRRLTRLEPPYLVNLLFRYAVLVLFAGERAHELFPHLLASMGYLHGLVYGKMSAVNCVAWSLEVELQFYLLAPLLTRLFLLNPKRMRRLLLIGLIVVFAALDVITESYPRLDLSIFSGMQYFLSGFLLVDIYLVDWAVPPRKSYWWDAVSLLSWAAIGAVDGLGEPGELIMSVPIFLAYLAAFKGRLSNSFFRQPAIFIIGGMCYTIYLYHYSIISVFVRLMAGSQFMKGAPIWMAIAISAAVTVPVILLICTLLFVFIEKPCMRRDWHLRLAERVRVHAGVPG